MRNVTNMFNRQRKALIYLTALFVLGWGFTPFNSVFLGLVVGTVGAYITHFTLVRGTNKVSEMAVSGKKANSIGTLSRIAVALGAVFLATEYPEQLNLLATIFGLITIYIVIMIDFLVFELLFSHTKRGEKDGT